MTHNHLRLIAQRAGVTQHVSNPPDPSPIGLWIHSLAEAIGAPSSSLDVLAGYIVERFEENRDEPPAKPAQDGGATVHVATVMESNGLTATIEGVSTSRDGALAMLGAAWLRDTAHGGTSSRLPSIETHDLDDPGSKAVGGEKA